jgi:hypothetical protein
MEPEERFLLGLLWSTREVQAALVRRDTSQRLNNDPDKSTRRAQIRHTSPIHTINNVNNDRPYDALNDAFSASSIELHLGIRHIEIARETGIQNTEPRRGGLNGDGHPTGGISKVAEGCQPFAKYPRC